MHTACQCAISDTFIGCRVTGCLDSQNNTGKWPWSIPWSPRPHGSSIWVRRSVAWAGSSWLTTSRSWSCRPPRAYPYHRGSTGGGYSWPQKCHPEKSQLRLFRAYSNQCFMPLKDRLSAEFNSTVFCWRSLIQSVEVIFCDNWFLY